MARMDYVNARLSALKESDKRVVYLITEDRDFLSELFRSCADTLKGLCSYKFKGDARNWKDKNLYACAAKEGFLGNLDSILGLSKIRFDGSSNKTDNASAKKILDEAAFLYITDFHLLKKDVEGEVLKQFVAYSRERERNGQPVYLFVLSPILQIPMGFSQDVEFIDVPEMDETDIKELLLREAESGDKKLHDLEQKRCERAAADFRGVPRREILQILQEVKSEYGSFYGLQDTHNAKQLDKIKESRQKLVADYKKEAAKRDSTITLLEPKDAISGMDAYLNWLEEIKGDFLQPEQAYTWGINPPKGVLLTGVPGSGKTQAAKTTAYKLGEGTGKVSLVQFRMDNLLGGLVGDSEANFKRCRKQVEALAPCVVLIDEIEKIFSTQKGSDSSGVKMNLLAALLDWLQENDKQIFFFATSNSVEGIAPELLRDGRFDMRMYAFMPTGKELVDVIKFHLDRANRMSGKLNRFGKFSSQYEILAEDFLREITKYAEDNNKDMFFTGSNIENLIKQTNQLLRQRGIEKPSKEDYLELMLERAESDRCQPYGETNMHSIVNFWILARKNKYSSTGKLELLPFAAFDDGACSFRDDKLPKCDGYDGYMQKRLREEIEKEMKKQSNSNPAQAKP